MSARGPLLATLVAALAIRIAGVDAQSLTMDEVTELQTASAPVAEIVVKADGFPPLYHLLLKGWTASGRAADVARWLSVVAGVVEQHGRADGPVLVLTGYMAEPLRFYLAPEWPVRALPDATPSAADATAIIAQTAPPFWVVYTRPFHGDPHGAVRAYLAAREDVPLAARFAGIELFEARTRPPARNAALP